MQLYSGIETNYKIVKFDCNLIILRFKILSVNSIC